MAAARPPRLALRHPRAVQLDVPADVLEPVLMCLALHANDAAQSARTRAAAAVRLPAAPEAPPAAGDSEDHHQPHPEELQEAIDYRGAAERVLEPLALEQLLIALNFGDYLGSALLTGTVTEVLARRLVVWHDAAKQGIPAHLLGPVLARLQGPALLAALNARPPLLPWSEIHSMWRDRYLHYMMRLRRLRESHELLTYVQFGMFGPKTSRNLTLLPDELQDWYDCVDSSVTADTERSCKRHLALLQSVWAFIESYGVYEPARHATLPRDGLFDRLDAAAPPAGGGAATSSEAGGDQPGRPKPSRSQTPPTSPARPGAKGPPGSPGSFRRVGGGFAVPVSKPSPTPKHLRQGAKRSGTRSVKSAPPKPSRSSDSKSRDDPLLANTLVLQRWARWVCARYLALRRAAAEAWELPIVPAVVELFDCKELVPTICSRFGHFPSLQVLDLKGCTTLNSACVEAIATLLPHLRFLDLSGASQCGDQDLCRLAGLQYLQSLQLCCWHNLSLAGFKKFAATLPANCIFPAVPPAQLGGRASHGTPQRLLLGQPQITAASLRALNLSDCRNICDDTLNVIATQLPGLDDLCVFGCLRLTDRGLIGFGNCESRLSRFCSSGAYKITDAGVRYLLSQNPSLQLYSNPNQFRDMRDSIVSSVVEDTNAPSLLK